MMKKLSDGMYMLSRAVGFAFSKPKAFIPLLICWGIFAPAIIYLDFYFPWERYSFGEIVGIGAIICFSYIFIISLASLVLLELLEQLETTGKMRLFKAIKDAFTRDLLKTLPVIIVWSTLFFIITSIEIIVEVIKNAGKKKSSRKRREPSTEEIAKSLTRSDGSLSSLSFHILKKGLRMLMFISLPAIAWEDQGGIKSMKKGFNLFKRRFSDFLTGMVLTEAFAILVGLPVGIFYLYTDRFEIEVSDTVWLVIILYSALTWSATMLVEQLYAAELYLWHLMWERENKKAKNLGKVRPKFHEVKKPSFLDRVPQLLPEQDDEPVENVS